MTTGRDGLDALRRTLHRDIDEDSASSLPLGELAGLVAADEGAAIEVYCINYGHLLRRLMRGMDLEAVCSLGESYLGMQPAAVLHQIADMRRVCDYANRILAGEIAREAAIAQMMTWKNADRRMITGLLEETFDIYRREGRRSFTPPDDEIGLPDGELHPDGGSFATSAPHVELDFRRLRRFDSEIGSLVRMVQGMIALFIVLLAIDVALWWSGAWFWAFMVLFPLWWMRKWMRHVTLIPRVAHAMRQLFHNALLTPGIIERVEPLTVVCLAPLGNGMGDSYWGLKRLRIRDLPLHEHRVGEVFPCVSGFEEGEADDRWADFIPRPISWGTGDLDKIRDLVVKLGSEGPELLRRCLREGLLPGKQQPLLVLDEGLKPVAP
jgi:hypothetical protein